jgi:hypothetical protein
MFLHALDCLALDKPQRLHRGVRRLDGIARRCRESGRGKRGCRNRGSEKEEDWGFHSGIVAGI